MFCKNRITLIGFVGQPAETAPRRASNGTVICWNKLGEWAAALQKGAYVEVELSGPQLGHFRMPRHPAFTDESMQSCGAVTQR